MHVIGNKRFKMNSNIISNVCMAKYKIKILLTPKILNCLYEQQPLINTFEILHIENFVENYFSEF